MQMSKETGSGTYPFSTVARAQHNAARVWAALGALRPGKSGRMPNIDLSGMTPKDVRELGFSQMPAGVTIPPVEGMNAWKVAKGSDWIGLQPEVIRTLSGQGHPLTPVRDTYPLQVLTHEFAHARQSPRTYADPAPWAVEGGAEAYSRLMASVLERSFGYPTVGWQFYAYPDQVAQVVRHRPTSWIARGQFR